VTPFTGDRASETTAKGVPVTQEDVHEDVQKISTRAGAREKGKRRRAGGARPNLDYLDEAGSS
jgi:hypothetical protein